jgi:hyperosmotically inducible protein
MSGSPFPQFHDRLSLARSRLMAAAMTRKLGWQGTILLGISVLVLAGCGTNNRYERSTSEFVDDKRLGSRVKQALNAQPVYKYPDVKIQTYRGTVQLSGFVATEAQKEAATEIARQVRGVGELENNILLAPLDQVRVRDYIPGRETSTDRANNTNEVNGARGGTSLDSRSATGSSTNTIR